MALPPLFAEASAPALDYRLCHVPGSRLEFRGPMPSFDAPYIAALGGYETFGKYVGAPFPELLTEWTGLPVANLGVAQAGLSLFSDETTLLDIASKSEVTILQVLAAQNMSNRLYSVHSRRNDRFVGVSPALRDLFPQVDFTEIHFTGHLMSTLMEASEAAFKVVVDELRWAWIQRMRRILSLIESDVVLLWVSTRPADDKKDAAWDAEPRFIDGAMIDEVRDGLAAFVEVEEAYDASLKGMIVPEGEEEAARQLPGPAAHQRIAEALVPVLAELGVGPGHAQDAARTKDQSFSIRSGTAVNRSATRP